MLRREWFRTVNVGGLPAVASYSSSSMPRAKIMSLLAFVVVFRAVDSDWTWSGSEVSAAEPERASDKKRAATIRNFRGFTVEGMK